MLSLKDGSPRKTVYVHKISNNEVLELQSELKKGTKTPEDVFWQYHQWIIEKPLSTLADKAFHTVWKKLTKPQKTIFIIGTFISQTNNGGTWQFIFNCPDYALAAAEAFHEAKPYSMHDYENALNEFAEMLKNGNYGQIMDIWNNQKLDWEIRWKAFKDGERHLPSCKKIDFYFYTDTFKTKFYSELNAYIAQRLGLMLEIETETKKSAKPLIDKKNAIPHFKEYLTNVFGTAPTAVSVYYNAKVTIDNRAEQLFLMQYAMPDGYESIGITGYFENHFSDVPLSEIKKMYQKFHKQELVNIYYGKYLVEQELTKNPKANQVNNEKWLELLEKLQLPQNSQVPVNVKFREYFKIGDNQWFIYEGDLLYNDNKENFPQNLNTVEIKGKSGFGGECGLLFSSGKSKDGFGRRSNKGILTGKYMLFDLVGAKFKLLKDNPWGF